MSLSKSALIKLLPFIIGLTLILFFYHRLFLPVPQLFFTPDFDKSDIINFHYPVKDFLRESLTHYQLPFWNKDDGTGYPYFAESQIGALYIPNLILYFFLPTYFAWNLSYVLLAFLSFTGSFLFLKSLKRSNFASFFSAFSFTFSCFFVLHVQHPNVIQAASLTPWIFYFVSKLFCRFRLLDLVLFILFLWQQQLVGFIQVSFITILGVIIFYLPQIYKDFKKHQLFIITILIGIITAILLALPQTLPTLELRNVSSRSNETQVLRFPYPIKFLATFISPKIFGTPKDASFVSNDPQVDGIYWENVGYFGLIPLLVAIYYLVSFKKRQRTNIETGVWLLLICSFLLMLGKNSPLYPIFYLPGFGTFRNPSRFILTFIFAAIILAATGFDYLIGQLRYKKFRHLTFISIILIVLTVVEIFSYMYNYNPLVPVTAVLTPPAITKFIPDNERTLVAYGAQWLEWNKVFDHQGFGNSTPYLYFQNSLFPTSNLLWHKSSVLDYSAMEPSRMESYLSILNYTNAAAMSAKYFISPKPLKYLNELKLITTLNPPEPTLPSYYLYQFTKPLPRFRFVSNYQVAKSHDDLLNKLQDSNFPFSSTALLESDPHLNLQPIQQNNVQLIINTNQQVKLKTLTDKPALLIMADSYYPGWQATINSQPTSILPVNLNQRAILVPAGENVISFVYVPTSFYKGVKIALITICLWIISLVYFIQSKKHNL
jgi:hypothetical protein